MPPNESETKKKRISRAASLQQIEGELRERVRLGYWTDGVMLPSRRRLAEDFGVDLPTVQRALVPLLEDGTLRADGGRGTFVAAPRSTPADPGSLPKYRGLGSLGQSRPRPAADMSIGVITGLYPKRTDDPRMEHWSLAVVHALERTLSEESGVVVREAARGASGAGMTLEDQALDLQRAGVDAFVILFADDAAGVRSLLTLIDTEKTPAVFAGSHDLGAVAPHVFYDSVFAGYDAARHLIAQGYSDLLYLSPVDHPFVQERLRGARQFVEGLPNRAARLTAEIGPGDGSDQPGSPLEMAEAQVRPFLDGLAGRGVIAANDLIAHGIMRAASSADLAAGKDYGIVGFDDDADSRSLGLTTLHPPLDAMGQEVGRLVMDSLRGHACPFQMRLRSYLIRRSSASRSLSLINHRKECQQ